MKKQRKRLLLMDKCANYKPVLGSAIMVNKDTKLLPNGSILSECSRFTTADGKGNMIFNINDCSLCVKFSEIGVIPMQNTDIIIGSWNELHDALKTLVYAIDSKEEPEKFKGQNKAYLEMVALPRAKKIIKSIENELKEKA